LVLLALEVLLLPQAQQQHLLVVLVAHQVLEHL
jgi:hypothetical protein